MPFDICMCSGGDCPQKDCCLRFTGVVYGRQDFFGIPPYDYQTNSCSYFMDDRPSHEAIQRKAYALWQEAGCPDGQELTFWSRAETYLIDLRFQYNTI